jgi:hypothetical protein
MESSANTTTVDSEIVNENRVDVNPEIINENKFHGWRMESSANTTTVDSEIVNENRVTVNPEIINENKFHCWRLELSANTIHRWLRNRQKKLSRWWPRNRHENYVVADSEIVSDNWVIYGFTFFLG